MVWGFPYLFMRVAVAEVSPVFVAWSRIVIAAALLLPLAAWRGGLAGAWRRRAWVALLGFYYLAAAWTLLPLAERVLPSSLTAIVISGVPICVTLLELPRERPTPRRVLGLVLGLGGVAALVGLDVGVRPAQLLALACLLAVLACYAAGPVLTARRLAGVDPIAIAALSLAFAGVYLLPAVAVQLPGRLPSPAALLSLAGLGVLCSGLAMGIWFFLIQEAGPARASIVTYINPAVAVLAGALILRERIGAATLAGMALILAGSWLATTGRRGSRRELAAA